MHSICTALKSHVSLRKTIGLTLSTIAVAAFTFTSAPAALAEEDPTDGYWLASRCKGARLSYEVRRDEVSGHVSVLYDIAANGRVENVRITESEPAGLMDMNVKNAMRGWRYFAYIKNGAEAARKDVSLTFTFGPKAPKEGKDCTHTELPESTTASVGG